METTKFKIEYLNIKEVKPYKFNPRKNEKAISIVADSIRKFYKVVVFIVTMPINKICEICGKIFKVKPSQKDRLKCCSKECFGKRRSLIFIGEKSANWKGGIEIHSHGWRWIYCPEHPNAHKGKVAEHRLIMEKKIGRYLSSQEMVHHINGDKTDNREENLELMSRSEHSKIHHPKGIRIGA